MEQFSLTIDPQPYRDLAFCYCGMHECEPGHSYGPAIRPTFLLHFVLKGKGAYYLNDQKYEIKKDQCFLIRPNELTFYQADQEDPWTYIWVGFDGQMAKKYLEHAGFIDNRLVLNVHDCETLKSYVAEMLNCNKSTHANELKYQGLLYLLLSKLSESSHIQTKQPSLQEDNHYVSKAIEFIENSYFNYIKVSDISHYLCLNRTYLTSLFQKHLGMSPQNFLIQFRMTKAADLLLQTDLSVANISHSCGYSDPLAFSKAFKKANGISPSEYRHLNH